MLKLVIRFFDLLAFTAEQRGAVTDATDATNKDRDRSKRLLVSIHDVGPRSQAAVEQLHDWLTRHVPSEKIAMLVVPDHGGEAPITPGSPFATRLRRWAEDGRDIFVHGWFHKDDSAHHGAAARLKARHMTAGEGEFLGLDLDTSLERMKRGRALIEDVTGRAVSGFVAPAWLYGPGALQALKLAGFDLAEDHMRVWRPRSRQVLCRGPVITWASRSSGRVASSLAAAKILPFLLRGVPAVRVAVHPGDITVPSLLSSIDRTVAALAQYRNAIRYADLIY